MLAIIVKNSPGSSPRAADESLRFLLCPDFGLLSLPEHSDHWGRIPALHKHKSKQIEHHRI